MAQTAIGTRNEDVDDVHFQRPWPPQQSVRVVLLAGLALRVVVPDVRVRLDLLPSAVDDRSQEIALVYSRLRGDAPSRPPSLP